MNVRTYTRDEVYAMARSEETTFGNMCDKLGIKFPKVHGGEVSATIDYGITPESLYVEPHTIPVDDQPTDPNRSIPVDPAPLPEQVHESTPRPMVQARSEVKPKTPKPEIQFPALDDDLRDGLFYSIDTNNLTIYSPENMFLVQILRDIELLKNNINDGLIDQATLLQALQIQGTDNKKSQETLVEMFEEINSKLTALGERLTNVETQTKNQCGKAVSKRSCSAKKAE